MTRIAPSREADLCPAEKLFLRTVQQFPPRPPRHLARALMAAEIIRVLAVIAIVVGGLAAVGAGIVQAGKQEIVR